MHRNGEQASLANLKMTIGSLLACSRLTGCHSLIYQKFLNLDDFLVESLVGCLLYLVTAITVSIPNYW